MRNLLNPALLLELKHQRIRSRFLIDVDPQKGFDGSQVIEVVAWQES